MSHIFLSIANIQLAVHDALWGNGWLLFPVMPMIVLGALIGVTLKKKLPIKNKPTGLVVSYGIGLIISILFFGWLCMNAAEAYRQDKIAIIQKTSPQFCAQHPELSLCSGE